MKVSDMLRIAHSVTDKVHTVNYATNVQDLAQSLSSKRIGALPVLQEGKLVGIVSERDIATKVTAHGLDPKKVTAFHIMSANPITVTSDNDLDHCLDLMEIGHFRHLPVVDNGKIMGMISIRDILVALLREKEDLLNHFESYLYSNR